VDPRRALSFGAAAEAYALARPSYPQEALRFALPAGAARVLDLGAGTGKLTSALLELGVDVVAVEPDDTMRALVDQRATALPGTAEEVPLPDASVDAVLVGQAWHWFDTPTALASVRRVLRPGGRLGLLWNVIDDTDGWPRAVADVVGMEDRLSLVSTSDTAPDDAGTAELAPWSRRLVPHTQRADADVLAANMASRSVVILRPEDERETLLDRVRSAAPPGEFDIPWVCDTWVAEV